MTLSERVRQTEFWLALVRGTSALALVVWLAWLLADTFWLVWQGPTDQVPADPNLDVVRVGKAAQQVSLSRQQVKSWQLFGAYQAPDKATGNKPVDAPETRLRLELLGVFQTGDGAGAGAIIAEQGGEGELFHPGEVLPGNATLEEVYSDRVILRRQGRLETLKLKEPALQGSVSQTRSTASRDQPSRQRAEATPQESADPGLRGGVERQRKQIISGLGLEKTESGYRISDSAPVEVINQVGLKPGDVIVSVNGRQVGEKAADLAALRDYHQTQSATIVVQRGAQRFTVTVPP